MSKWRCLVLDRYGPATWECQVADGEWQGVSEDDVEASLNKLEEQVRTLATLCALHGVDSSLLVSIVKPHVAVSLK